MWFSRKSISCYFWQRDIRPKHRLRRGWYIQPVCIAGFLSINRRMARSRDQGFLHWILHGFHHMCFKMQASDAILHWLNIRSFISNFAGNQGGRCDDVLSVCMSCFRWAGCLSFRQSGQHDMWNLTERWLSICKNELMTADRTFFHPYVNTCTSQESYWWISTIKFLLNKNERLHLLITHSWCKCSKIKWYFYIWLKYCLNLKGLHFLLYCAPKDEHRTSQRSGWYISPELS